MKDVDLLVNHLMFKLGDSAFVPPTSRNPKDCIVGIYHSLSWDKYKERLVADLKNDLKKRLDVAITASSMGVNFPDIRYMIILVPRAHDPFGLRQGSILGADQKNRGL